MSGGTAVATKAERPPRPDVLAYPSPAGARYVLLVLALLVTGAWLGNFFHNVVRGDAWLRDMVQCVSEAETQALGRFAAGLDPLDHFVAQFAAQQDCFAPVERVRTAYSLAGMLVMTALSVSVLLVAPLVIERRRRLRPPGDLWSDLVGHVGDLAREEKVPRAPRVMLGSAAQRDAFTYGLPGHYRMALPMAIGVRWRDSSLFDPVVRHELAHLRRGDATLVWLARSVWYVLGPLLAVPIAVVLAMGDHTFLTRYIWRAALLALTVQLVSRALLREREHEADLRSTGHGLGPSPLMAVLGRLEAGTQPTKRWRQWLATHPSPQERLRVLDRPERVAGVGFVDGFVAAFLAALALSLVQSVLYVSLTAVNLSEHVSLLSSAVGGLLLAVGVGLGLWRAALVRRLVGEPVRPTPAALGVAVGLVLGQSASLQQIGRETIIGIDQPVWVLLATALLGIGVTALSASLGELWADAAATAGGPRRSWLLALSANFVLFWAFLTVLSLQDAGRLGWDLTRAWLVTGMSTLPLLGALATVVAVVVWGLAAGRRARSAPAWLVDEPTEPAWPVGAQFNAGLPAVAGVAAGAMTTLSIVAFRLVSGPALDEAAQWERFDTYIWVVAAVGMAVTLLFAALVPRRGIAVGTVAGLSATLTGIVGLVAFNTALGGDLNVPFVLHFARPAAALGFVLMLAVAPAGLYAWQRSPATAVTPHRPTVWRTAAVALLVAAAVFAGRGYLIGAPDPALDDDTYDYVWRVGPSLLARVNQLSDAAREIDADAGTTGLYRAARYRDEILPQLATLTSHAVAATPAEGDARAAHEILLEALSETRRALETYVHWLESGDGISQRDFTRSIARTQELGAAYAEAVASMVEGRTTLPSVR
jgi:hypothetical protein